jgi:hypothetical protein
MPYGVAKHDSCPASRPWGVTNTVTGTLHGCHPTKAKAQAQQRALYANEPRAAMLNATLAETAAKAEATYLSLLVTGYETSITEIAGQASDHFALTAAATDWQPPAEGAIITTASVATIAKRLNKTLAPVWEKIIIDVARAPLARIEVDWTLKHPLAQNLLQQAGQRTGQRLGEAVQFTLRETLAHAYQEGLSASDTSKLIQQKIAGAAPFQADMLARSDLNSLSNGASKAAAQLSGVGFKTWVSALLSTTRPEHAEAHGQTVAINDTFLVGGESADYPGDPVLSDAQSCNCVCTLVYGDTLAEAQGLIAAAEDPFIVALRKAMAEPIDLSTSERNSIMGNMATKAQRQKRYERRAAHGKTKLATEPQVVRYPSDMVPVIEYGEDGNDRLVSIVAAARSIRFSGTAAIEGQIADDNSLTPRVLLPDSLEWPEMPVSFMAQTATAEGHDGAQVAGRVDELARSRSTGKKRSITMSGELTTPFGINEIAPMIDDKTLRYVSADLGATEWCIVNRDTLAEVPMEDLTPEDLSAGTYALALMSGKVKAVTLVPTQALEGAMVALTASADDDTATLIFEIELGTEQTDALVASPAPVNPPRSWFETAEPPGKMPLTITEDGRVYGHLATWDSCHVSFLPQCVPPPKSSSNYAYFHVCEIDSEDGGELTVGKLMFSPDNGGHADRRLSASKASAHYDKTGMAAAYLRVTDGQHGIWAAGALNPDLTDKQRQQMRRELRLNPPSGDWRPINGQYELICGLAVAVPGFPVPRAVMSLVAAGDSIELCDALIASSGHIDPDPAAVAALEHQGLVDEDLVAERRMKALAARAEGLDSLAALAE